EGLLGGRGHPDGRMGELIRARRDCRVLEAVILTSVAELLALPGLQDDLQGFAKARLTFFIGNPVHVVGTRGSAPTDPEIEATLADVIYRRNLFGDAQRVVQGEELNRRPDRKSTRLNSSHVAISYA